MLEGGSMAKDWERLEDLKCFKRTGRERSTAEFKSSVEERRTGEVGAWKWRWEVDKRRMRGGSGSVGGCGVGIG